MRWTEDRIRRLSELAATGMSGRDVAARLTSDLGEAVSYKAVRRRAEKSGIALRGNPRRSTPSTISEAAARESVSVVDDGDSRVVTLKSRTIRTLDDAVREARIDLDAWSVKRFVANKWDQGSRLPDAAGGGVQVVELWQVKIWLERAAPEPITLAFERLCARLPAARPRRIRARRVRDPHLLEVCLFDAHFGKLCWGQETGTPFDVRIARRVYADAVEDLLARVRGYPVERVLYPLGQDFFQVDNWIGTTASGTQVDTDGRFQRTFEAGVEAVIESVRMCLQVAPVKIVWVPGNHDVATSWYLAKIIQAHFRSDPQVTVNASPERRKYHRYGAALIGFTHGDKVRLDSLPTTMASERPDDFAAASCREWHVGHHHRRREWRFTAGETLGLVGVRVLPSLSGTDAWHHERGFVKTDRAAEAYLWSRADGYVGHFAVNVRGAAATGAKKKRKKGGRA